MKGKMEKEIREILLEIIELLEITGEHGWASNLKRLYADNYSSRGVFITPKIIWQLCILMDRQKMVQENNKLSQLREQLYESMVQSFVE